MRTQSFVMAQREAQTAFFAGDNPEAVGFEDSPYRLHSKNLNLAPVIREHGIKYFGDHGIVWHTHANHGLSSQVCCLNFLMPLADKPELLAAFVGHVLDIAPPEMLAIDEINGSLVGFEWVGKDSYLNETRGSAKPGRGAHATSADAIVRFRHKGRVEALLIEWKYTESYGAPLDPDGNETRVKRYKDIALRAGRADPQRHRLGCRGLLLGAVLSAAPPTNASLPDAEALRERCRACACSPHRAGRE